MELKVTWGISREKQWEGKLVKYTFKAEVFADYRAHARCGISWHGAERRGKMKRNKVQNYKLASVVTVWEPVHVPAVPVPVYLPWQTAKLGLFHTRKTHMKLLALAWPSSGLNAFCRVSQWIKDLYLCLSLFLSVSLTFKIFLKV